MGNTENAVDRPASRRGRATRALVAGACAAALALGVSGCGFEAQTLQPYTPAQGVNVDVGQNPDNQEPAVKIRGLVVITEDDGVESVPTTGFLSAALYAGGEPDALVGVGGTAIGVDGEPAGALTVDEFAPLPISPTAPLVLVDQPAIVVRSPDLLAGATVELTLQLQNAGSVDVVVPVVDGASPDYRTVTPVPATPSATPSATPAGS